MTIFYFFRPKQRLAGPRYLSWMRPGVEKISDMTELTADNINHQVKQFIKGDSCTASEQRTCWVGINSQPQVYYCHLGPYTFLVSVSSCLLRGLSATYVSRVPRSLFVTTNKEKYGPALSLGSTQSRTMPFVFTTNVFYGIWRLACGCFCAAPWELPRASAPCFHDHHDCRVCSKAVSSAKRNGDRWQRRKIF